jgi:hypothetical protein
MTRDHLIKSTKPRFKAPIQSFNSKLPFENKILVVNLSTDIGNCGSLMSGRPLQKLLISGQAAAQSRVQMTWDETDLLDAHSVPHPYDMLRGAG